MKFKRKQKSQEPKLLKTELWGFGGPSFQREGKIPEGATHLEYKVNDRMTNFELWWWRK